MDNVELNPGVGGATIATDEDGGGAQHQYVKLEFGADGTQTPVTAAAPLPVTTISSALPSGAATSAKQDTGNTSLASIDGKITAVDTGAVVVASSALPTGAATSAKQDTQITAEQAIQAAVQIMDDWDEADRAKVNLIVGQAGIAAGTGLDGVTVPRVTLATDVPLPAGTNAIGKLAANAGVTIGAVELAAAQTLATVTTVSTVTSVTAIANALPAGTNAIGKLAANSGVDIGDVDVTSLPTGASAAQVQGTIAHDSADGQNPVKIGGRADTTFQTAVADGDRVDALFDVYGVAEVRTDHPNKWSYHENSSSALTDATVQAAPGAGLSVYITDIILSLGAATALNLFLEEGSTVIIGPYYLEAINGRSFHMRFATPKKCTANTAVTVTTSAAVAHGLDILGFIAP